MKNGPIRVLVLTSSTGGGHDTRARALRDWAALEKTASGGPAWEIELSQALEDSSPIFRLGVEIYNAIQRYWPALHHIYYNLLEVISFTGGAEGEGMSGRKGFMESVRIAQPDLVISTHDHLNHAFLASAKAAIPKVPPKTATYCTELFGGYGFSRHWVNPKADLYIGAVEESCDEARRLNMPPDRAWLGGFLLDPAFWSPRDEKAETAFLRGELGLEPGRLTILLSTGANSAQNHVALLDVLVAAKLPAKSVQIIALCGHDAKARDELDGWAARHPDLPVKTLPRVSNLALLMRVCSVVVARPGTGTTSEAILTGIPILFNTLGGIMPQEIITVKFCRKHGFGRVLKHPKDLAETVRGWLAEPAKLAAEREHAAASRPNRTPADILRRLRELVETGR